MNVSLAVHVRMEERVPICQEATSVHVMWNILEKIAKQVGYPKKLDRLGKSFFVWRVMKIVRNM